ncbi:MAG: BlaI/MecI/CopY family transcriptional regulator [Planctomycetota bacterium]
MKLTEAEWQIMNALWQNWPATARQIADRLPENVNWAYTTIKTMLTRLAEKNAVKETKKGSIGLYEPILTRKNARRSALKALADHAFDGTFGPLMHFLLEDQNLSKAQRKELLKTLQKQNNKKKGGRNDRTD